MKAKTPSELANILIEHGLATAESIIGCSEDEISELESHFQIRLPESYKQYLKTMGKEMGDFANDVIMTFPGILQFCRSEAESYAAEKAFVLAQNHFVFLTREDVFMFFDSSLADPPVLRLDTVVDTEPVIVCDSFLDYLTTYVNDEASVARQ